LRYIGNREGFKKRVLIRTKQGCNIISGIKAFLDTLVIFPRLIEKGLRL